jgi:hypothetical protein
MCDYSLQHLASRPAKVDDKLITSRFKYSITGGFAAVNQPDVAVCLLPGTELAFEADVEIAPVFRFLPHRKLTGRVARFRRVNEEHQSMHHDALEFVDGKIVLLTDLREGQCASVLQLPAGAVEAPAEATPASTRVAELV